MMPWMCDSLLPVLDRNVSMKYRRLSRWFNPFVGITRAELIECRAMMNTPGLTDIQVGGLMNWDRHMYDHLKVLAELDEEAEPLVQANLRSVTAEDGRMMLVNILGNFPNWRKSIPLWSTRYLLDRKRMGATAVRLAFELGVKPRDIRRWQKADLFDPLTAMPLPRSVLQGRRR